MRINKYFFKGLNKDIYNQNFLKTLPFCTFSDLKNPDYPLIGEVLDTIKFDKNTFISIGKNKAPFGMTLFPDNKKMLIDLFNSCQFSFIFTRDINETDFLLQSVLGGIIPICNCEHLFVKKLGLSRYAVDVNVENVLRKLITIKTNPEFETLRINQLSWRYKRAMKKWR